MNFNNKYDNYFTNKTTFSFSVVNGKAMSVPPMTFTVANTPLKNMR